MKIFLTILSTLIILNVNGQNIIGKWKMVGMKSGKERSLIHVYEEDGLYYGKIIEVYPNEDEDQNPICDKCTDDRKDMPLVGMNIITGLEYSGRTGEYRGGQILDPATGAVYDCKAWLGKDGYLRIRGYMFFIGKTYILPKYSEE